MRKSSQKKIISIGTFVIVLLLFLFSPACATGFDAEKVSKSVFVIRTIESEGSGFAIGKNCIITNEHVVGNESEVLIKTHDDAFYFGDVVKKDSTIDLAVILVKNADFPVLRVASDSSIKVGMDVYAMGSPRGFEYTITKGILSSKDREVEGQLYLQTDTPINSGNSGGPLINDKGNVIGVNTWKLADTEGMGFSIPISVVTDYLAGFGIELTRTGNVAGYLEPGDFDNQGGVPIRDPMRSPFGTNLLLILIGAGIVIVVLALIIIRLRSGTTPRPVRPARDAYTTNYTSATKPSQDDYTKPYKDRGRRKDKDPYSD